MEKDIIYNNHSLYSTCINALQLSITKNFRSLLLDIIESLKSNYTNINNISPLRYPGGKTRACEILDNIINEHFNITEFSNLISPFFGGGSFEFYMQNKYGMYIYGNDKCHLLYNFWAQAKKK
jgi:hypothetical protein